MKLAEVLLLRADLQKKLASLQERAKKYALVQEGERPAEDPKELLRQIETVADELKRVIVAINKANIEHVVGASKTITEALAERDVLQLRHGIVQSVIDACAKPPDRYGVKEIRWVKTVDVAKLQKQADSLSKHLRELNARIQEVGWQVEVDI